MPIPLLLSVLPLKGVGPKLCIWMSNFLRNRSFRVKVHGALSRTGSPKTGCPQGTALASLLFSFSIDQVKFVLDDRVDYLIYADDLKLYKSIERR